ESLTILKDLDDKELIASLLDDVAEAVTAQGGLTWAAQLWGAAGSIREANGSLLLPDDYFSYNRAVLAARTQLGEEVFTAAWAKGRTMSLEQVLNAQGYAKLPKQIPLVPRPIFTEKSSPVPPTELTRREVEVLRLLTKG